MSKEIIPSTTQPGHAQQSIVVNIDKERSNSLGTAGFVLSLIAVVFCWIPVVDFLLWFLGALFSFIGLFKSPRGLAIAGFIISFIGLIIVIAFVGSFMAFSSVSGATDIS